MHSLHRDGIFLFAVVVAVVVVVVAAGLYIVFIARCSFVTF